MGTMRASPFAYLLAVVGEGGAGGATAAARGKRSFEGVGEVFALQRWKNRIVVDREEIKDFMAEMVMSYRVVPITLLEGLETGDKIRFVIDTDRQAIVKIEPLPD